jgi:general stress protein 26
MTSEAEAEITMGDEKARDEKDGRDKVWVLMGTVKFCMLTTLEGEDLRARPMSAHIDRDANAIYFLTDVDSHKDEDIARNPSVGLAFADVSGQKYVSVSGRAEVSNDRHKIAELWSVWAKAWWSGPHDARVRVLKVNPKDAHFWDSPGTVTSYVKMLAAAVSDARPAVGDSGTVRLQP